MPRARRSAVPSAVFQTSTLCAAVCMLFAESSFGAQVTTFAVPISVSAGGASTISPWPFSLAIDPARNIYIAGNAQSNITGTPGAFQPQPPAKDPVQCPTPLLFDGRCMTPFVAKLDPTGTRIIYLTYLSGNLNDYISSIAVDAQGSVYAAGWTNSTNFPTTANSLRNFSPHAWPAFVVKLNPSGSGIEYGALLGGSGWEGQPVASVAVDAGGNAYIIGSTDSKDFPITQGAFQPSPGTAVAYGDNGYIVKLNTSGSALVYSSYITAAPRAIALDKNGRAYVTGQSWGRLPTTPGVVQRQNNGLSDAFVMKIGIDGTLLYSTYVGGPAIDSGFGIAVDDQGSAYVTGDTREDELNSALTQPQFPVTTGAFQTVFNGTFQSGNGADAFVFKLSPDGSSLVYSTYLGGGGFDTGIGIQVTAQGEALVVGSSESINFPTTRDAFVSITPLRPYGGNPDESFLAQFDNAGRKLQYSTYLMRSSGQLAFHSVTGVVYAVVLREDGSPEVARVDLAAEPPTPFLGGIGNAASYQGGTVAPGEMVLLLGRGIGPSPGVSASGLLGAIGTSTGGVQVFFDEIAAPVLFASSDEVHAQAPFEIAGRSMVLINIKYGGNDSNSIQLQVIDAIPGIFTVNGRGSGQAAILNQDDTINSPANPAARGSIVSLFLTGGGVTNPPSGTGQITPLSALRLLSGGVRVSMETLAGARIMFAGTAPGFVSGLVQVNAQVPLDAPAGDSVPLFLTVVGDNPPQDFQSGVTIAIR